LDAIPRIRVDESRSSTHSLRIHVRRLNRGYTDRNLIYAPKFPKPQQESWFVLASDSQKQKLFALQRVTLSGRGNGEGSTEVQIPSTYAGESVHLTVISDGWREIIVEKVVEWKKVDTNPAIENT